MHLDAKYRLRFRQEDPPLSSQWIQEIRCAQCQRVGTFDDAQQVTHFTAQADSQLPIFSISLVSFH